MISAPETSKASLLAFRISDRTLCIPAAGVREISKVPPLTPVPHAPESLLGLGSIRGEPVPVVALSRLLGIDDGRQRKLVIIDGTPPIALAVDEVLGISAEDESGELVAVDSLLAAAFPARQAVLGGVRASRRESSVEADGTSFLALGIGDQLFALPVDQIEQVLRLPDDIASLPQARAGRIGSIEFRGGVLALLSLPTLLGMRETRTAASRIIVARIDKQVVGLIVDSVGQVFRAAADTIDPVPPPLIDGNAEAVIRSIHRPGRGRRLISILDTLGLLDAEIVATLSSAAEGGGETERGVEGERERLLLFESAGHRFAIPLRSIQEVSLAQRDIAPLPGTPLFIAGAASHRGQAIPVVDLSVHIGDGAKSCDRRQMLVVQIAGAETGLLVDRIDRIIQIPKAATKYAPALGDRGTEIFDRVVTIDGDERVILVFEAGQLFGRIETDLIAGLHRGSAAAR